jgi:tetratricopeptide (TPR) repeat protein
LVETAGGEKGIDYEYAKSWIENRTEWLLIFDNADDITIDYHKYLPSGNGSCILMTTRNDACKSYGSESAGYEKFEKLEFDDAVELLLKSAGATRSPDNLKLAQNLVGDDFLAQHALSIVQAGAFIRKGLCRLVQYADMFQTQREMLLRSHPDQADSIYGDVYATFEVSATAIRASSKKESRDALELLNVLAYLHRETVLEDMFTRAWEQSLDTNDFFNDPEDTIRNLSQWHVDRVRRFLHPASSTKELDLISFRNARQVLLSFSLVNMHPDTYEISMHPLVHTWARDRLVVEEQHEAWATAAATLSLSIDAFIYREYFKNLQPHIEFSLIMFHKESLPVPKWSTLEICRIFYRYAWVFERQYHSTGFKKVMDLISSLECPEIPTNSLNWRHVLYLYSSCHRDLGNYEEQLQLIEKVVAFDTRTMEPANLDLLNSQNDLAVAQFFQGKYREAIKLLQEVVTIQQEILSPDHPNLFASKHKLAKAYAGNNQQEKAIELFQEVVRIQQGILAPTHPDRLASEHELASAYIDTQKPDQAIKILEEVVRIRQGILAPTHPERLVSEHELASAYTNTQKPDQAIKILEEVVRIRQGILAPTHPDRLHSEHELARAYYGMGQYQKSLPIIEEVVRIRTETLLPDHRDRIVSEELLEGCVSAIEEEREEIASQPH